MHPEAMDSGALNDALETGRWQRFAGSLGDDALQPIVDKRFKVVAQAIEFDTARLEDRRRILVLRHRKQQVLERGVFVPSLAG